MASLVQKIIASKVYAFLSRRMVYHSIFWLIFLGTLVNMDNRDEMSVAYSFLVEIINTSFFALIVYFNLFYLIPRYLNDKSFLLYCLVLVFSILVLTPIKILILYFVLIDYPETQESLIVNFNLMFLLAFIIVGSSTILKIISDWVRYQRDRRELQTQTMQSELKFLKSQINPHFLFNTLNNLYALTLKKSDKAPEIVIKLSEMMRYMLYECNEKRVLLSKEVSYIRNYLDLERLRQAKNFEINFEVKGHVTDQKIAPLMFIPFLENSFKHGLNNQISQGFVAIKMEVNERSVDFFIENSKAEKLPAIEHRRSGGIGLVNVRRRLNLLYPNHYYLDIKDNPNTYTVNLKLDLDI
ncbi:MAG: two-component system LytT family sensor kinase [Saprospiraceae bacterium]|jgi:two-component system LytT family sensor kinase